ncbi:MAG TPA: hypothetical protein DEG23_02500 [Coxiellaceae bacterium]|nr:MAG: hypothetical protein A2V89_00805 [Gammaproteobacteria bacterium RBG_16_37_9]HBC71934.1 hypothetical protein [Coxiellaceae bacterium]HBY55668.1 hypothetical protein [Coxiellaceae bacterium]
MLELEMLDWIAHLFLKFGHITFIFPMVILGMIFHKRELYAKAACFLFFVIIWNALLKYMFKIPLPLHLGDGYAFPSGHMHATAVFYGYILYKTDNKIIKTLLVVLLGLIGFSLIYCQFHDLFAVLAAVGFAIAEITLYHFLLLNLESKYIAAVAIFGSLVIMVILSIIYKVEGHVWLAFYALVGTIFSLTTINDLKPKLITQKFLALLMIAFFVFAVYAIFRIINFNKPFLSEIKFMLFPIIIMGSINISSRFKCRINK